ncbi:PaaI family thioesterase [Chitinilyticum litopenaei]|uniref:PaaI family thioesterase n=1 Tax=Chitinilyticum litopenaei TaxID=1121276 RepID=UPI0003F66BCC|nr:PaaI family thioesterase [Chitinilyticum litopenaei]
MSPHWQVNSIAELDQLLQARIPYAALLGIRARAGEDGEPLFLLPYREANIGNVQLPALHGGVIGGFLENAAVMHLLWAREAFELPKVVDFSIDYLRSGKPLDTWARCEIVRQGKRIANVLMSAWQDDPARPIAQARAHFLLA